MNTDKLEQIELSYINGQKRQMVKQIKAYGVKAFHIDFWDYCQLWASIPQNRYTEVVYNFHLLNS